MPEVCDMKNKRVLLLVCGSKVASIPKQACKVTTTEREQIIQLFHTTRTMVKTKFMLPIWNFNSKGTYSVQPLYTTINFRGIQPVYTHAMWKFKVPCRVHVFLWLSNSRLLNRDSLTIRIKLDNTMTCLFWTENETINHLYFYCCVANRI